MALALPTSLTPSKVSAFKDCALAFRFSVIDRVPQPPSAPAVKGTLVHRALELLMWEEEPGNRSIEMALEKLEIAFTEMKASDPEFLGLGLEGKDETEFVADARTLVKNYFELEDPNEITVIGTELMMEVKVGTLRLRGIIDRLERDATGRLIVTDYKTGRAPSEKYEQGKLGGVHFYAFLCESVLGEIPDRVQLYHLREPMAIVAEPNLQSIRGLKQKTGAIWTAVERACRDEDFRPKTGPLCNWCSFTAYCPSFGGDPSLATSPIDLGSARHQQTIPEA